MLTRGERYKFDDGEQELVDKVNVLLREAYAKLKEAEHLAESAPWGWFVTVYWDLDNDGNPELPSNYATEIRINVDVDNGWMSSTQDC
jgi:hypothetical protein